MRYSLAENPTVFGKILRGEIPCRKVYEDDHVLAFHDIAPKAPVHVIVIIKHHLSSAQSAAEASASELGNFWQSVAKVVETLNVPGCRLITNCGTEQEVPHLHVHLLADPNGKPLPGF
ncbi:MAG: HIT domain-containing protein [Alphaproteobacteria bacterium]|jgi:diadenosine tetraphosphate (Ap4A) HIT family hydrolase|nr:HIT domain-containing protein [Alphaproteobacteria bacterium]